MKVANYTLIAFFWACQFLLWIPSIYAQDGNHRYVRADELRDHSGFCFDATRCALKRPGEKWTVDKTCEKATCHVASNGTLVEKRTSCVEITPIFSEECYVVRIEGMPFPDCCPKMFCNDKPISLPFLK